MKKPFKTLAALLPAITLISNLSPVGAKENYSLNFNYEEISRERNEIEIMSEEEQRLAEELRRAEEQRRLEEHRRNIIKNLEEISFISQRNPYRFTFNIPHEPVEQMLVESMIIKAKQDMQNLRPTDQTMFSLDEFKVLDLVRKLQNSLGDDSDNCKKNLTYFEAIEYLYLVYPKTSVILKANRIKVSYKKNKLDITLFLDSKVLDMFTLSTLTSEEHLN